MLKFQIIFFIDYKLTYICAQFIEKLNNSLFLLIVRGCGEIGRRARLRIWCREAWGFESLHPYKCFICSYPSWVTAKFF